MANGTKWAGIAAILVGLFLLGLCASQWDRDTGSTMGHALSAYNGGDQRDLASLGSGALQQSSQTGLEGLAGVFWLGIGIFLVKKAGGERAGNSYRREPPRRR